MSPNVPFDDQPRLDGAQLKLRPLEQSHFDGLFEAASDPKIWEQHPVKDRFKRDVFKPYFTFLLESGGTLVAMDKETGQIIGCSRYYETQREPNSISIGYTFLKREYWGGPTNLVVKTLMIEHAFKYVPAVWLHIGPDNQRSQKATEKIGAVYVRTEPMQIVGSDGTMLCYRLLREDWKAI